MGGAGCYIAEKIGNAHNCEVVAINDSHSTLTDKKAHHKLNLNLENSNGRIPTPEQLVMAANSISSNFQQLIQHKQKVIIVVGLGGNTGTNVAPVLAKIAKEHNKSITIVATLPFDFESQRQAIADTALLKLKADFNNIIIHDHSAHNNSEKSLLISLEDYFAEVADQLAAEYEPHILFWG